MRKKTLFGIIGAILLAAVFFVCAVGSSWFTNGDIKTWFNGWGYGKPEENKEQSNVIMTEGGSNGVALMCAEIPVAEFAAYSLDEEETESAFTLTLEVTPENSVVTNFTWSAEFVNPQSEWASGKDINDYYTVTPAEDNRSAVAACKQAFGEQIRIKAVYDGDTTIFATKLADYVKKIVGYTFNTTCNYITNDTEWGEYSPEQDIKNIEWGVGTVGGRFYFDEIEDKYGCYAELSDEAYDYLTSTDSSAHNYMSQFLAANSGVELIKNTRFFQKEVNSNELMWCLGPTDFLSKKSNLNQVQYFEAAFKSMLNNTTNHVRFVVKATYSYNSYTETVVFNSNWWTANDDITLVTGINIGGENLLH